MGLIAWGCCAALLSAARPAVADSQAAFDEVEDMLAQWRIEEAEERYRRLPLPSTRSPRARATYALLLFHQGDFKGAVAEMTAAFELGRDPGRRVRAMFDLMRTTAKTLKGYVEHRSPGGHFRIHVAPGPDELLVPFTASTLEAMRARLARDLGYAPNTPVRVEIYPRVEDLAAVSTLSREDIERTGTVALCKYNRLMIVTPRALLRGYSWRDTLAHEYVHFVVSRLSRNRVPIWLQEGLAKWLETRWRTPVPTEPRLTPVEEHVLHEALHGETRLIAWSDMHPSMAKLPSQRATALAFAQVYLAIAFVARQGGPTALGRMIDEMRQGKSDWQAVAAVTGLDRRAFDGAYLRFLRELKPRRMPGLTPLERRFHAKQSEEQRLAELRQVNARRHFRLAGMLRQRRHIAAAILEYRKAQQLAGPREALLANALARSYLELDRPEPAIAVLQPVIEYYPELAAPQTSLGLAYLRAGRTKEATAHLRAALRVNPFDPDVHCGLARSTASPAARQRHRELCARLNAQEPPTEPPPAAPREPG